MPSRGQERGNNRKRFRGNLRNNTRGNGDRHDRHSFHHEALNDSTEESTNGMQRNAAGYSGGRRHHQNSQYSYHNNRRNAQSQSSNSRASSRSDAPPIEESTEPVSEVREIPGFYFDPEKKKYFKITPNHVFGSEHPFSQQSIKRRTEVEIKPTLDPIIKHAKRKNHLTMSNYGSLSLLLRDSTLGLLRDPRRKLFEVHALLTKEWKNIDSTPHRLPMEHIEDRHGHIQIDSSGQYLYYATSGGTIWKQQITIGISYPSADWTPLINVGSKVTSFHMTSDDKIITTSLGDGGRSGGLFCFIPPKSSIGYISELFSVSPRKTSVWTSSVAGDRIVFGADRMAIYIQGWRSERIQQVKLSTGSDVFSTAIDLPERHNLVYLGCRNGNVQAFDLNQPNLFYNTNSGHHSNNSNSSNRAASIFSGIGHKESSVQCMKRASENYLVTAATNGEILAWDTRFISTNTVNSKVGSFSKPIMDIRKPMDGYSTKVLFDINRDETLLAAESIGSKLSLWSLRTGDRIRDLETSGAINSLKFSNESPGIWVAVNDLVQYWGLE